MAREIRIHTQDTLTITLSGLTPEQSSLLMDIQQTPVTFFRPGFASLKPGELSLIGTPEQLRRFSQASNSGPRALKQLTEKIHALLDNYLRTDYKIPLRGALLDLGGRTHVMGVLNVTPDSFSDGGLYANTDRAVERGIKMAQEGADLIDIGGESTRPGAQAVSEDEELGRTIPIIERLSREIATPISVDTYKSGVADKALKAGASIVNDISGLRFSPDMAKVAAEHNAAVIIMQIKGTPGDMQANPVYADVVGEIIAYLRESLELALKAGVSRDRILIDPGIGFGKTLEHNLIILDRLNEFRVLGCPIVLGTSRKRFIGTVLDIPEPDQRVEGTAATIALGIAQGAHVVRVHDVAQMAKVARMTDAILKTKL